NKAVAWSSYIGVKYTLPYGVNAEIGWKHEEIKWKDGAYYSRPNDGEALVKNKIKSTKVRGDTIYAHLGFDF
ncbi:MAG: hypothetical protein LBT97_12415, partial [Planctomycetota bacterium]|nr:hypothetical protein [Planctomycetota bacterium]